MTYAEAVNSLESYLQNIDSAISFENWMLAASEEISVIYGYASIQHQNFQSLKKDFASSKTGLTDPVKYRINEKNFRLRAKSHLAFLVTGLREAEQLAIRQANQKKKEEEEQRLREQKAAEQKRLQEEQEAKKLEDKINAVSRQKEPQTIIKKSRRTKAIPWIIAPFLAAALFYAGYTLGSRSEETEKLHLSKENHVLKQNIFNLKDSLYQQKQVVNQQFDSSSAK